MAVQKTWIAFTSGIRRQPQENGLTGFGENLKLPKTLDFKEIPKTRRLW
jgi:hypothetical protein